MYWIEIICADDDPYITTTLKTPDPQEIIKLVTMVSGLQPHATRVQFEGPQISLVRHDVDLISVLGLLQDKLTPDPSATTKEPVHE